MIARMLILLWIALQASTPVLTGAWQSDGYAVVWSAPEDACLWMDDRLLPIPCAASGSTVIGRYGDAAYVASPGRMLRLTTRNGMEMTRIVIDAPGPYRVALPLVAAE